MYKVTVYQTESGTWKWKLSYRDNALARSDRGYSTSSRAKRSFVRILQNLKSSYGLPKIEIEHNWDFNKKK